jgi:hypothetical protein
MVFEGPGASPTLERIASVQRGIRPRQAGWAATGYLESGDRRRVPSKARGPLSTIEGGPVG